MQLGHRITWFHNRAHGRYRKISPSKSTNHRLRHQLIPVWFMITSHQLHLSDYSLGFPIMQASRHEGEGGHPPRLHVQTTVLSYKGYPRPLCKLISMGTRLNSVHFTFNSNFCRYSVPTIMNQSRWPTLSTLPYVGGTSGSIPKLGKSGYPCGLNCTPAPQVSGLTSLTIRRIFFKYSSLLLAATKKEWETDFEKWRSQPSWL